jgi:hypothetical protein
MRRLGMDRGTAMLAVVLDVYEGGKDLIPGWKLKEHAERALAAACSAARVYFGNPG